MSQKATKREIAGVLADRDERWKMIEHIGSVMCELRKHGEAQHHATLEALGDVASAVVDEIAALNECADAMVGTLRTPKTSFSGRHLHRRGS